MNQPPPEFLNSLTFVNKFYPPPIKGGDTPYLQLQLLTILKQLSTFNFQLIKTDTMSTCVVKNTLNLQFHPRGGACSYKKILSFSPSSRHNVYVRSTQTPFGNKFRKGQFLLPQGYVKVLWNVILANFSDHQSM